MENERKEINSIVIIMFGLLGDVFMRTPILRALKSIYPNVHITVLVDAIGATVLENNSNCDDIIVTDRSKKSKFHYYRNKIKTIIEVRSLKADMLIDLYNGGSSPFISFSSSAKYRLGYARQKEKYAYNIKSNYIAYQNGIIDSYNKQILSILEPLSAQQFSLVPDFVVPDDAKIYIEKYVHELDIEESRSYILNLGSGGLDKLLDNKLYYELIEYIYERYSFFPLIVANPGQEYLQKSLIKEYLSTTNIPFVKLKLLSLNNIAALIDRTKFIITPDTGLMHLAFSLNVYTFAIFRYTNPKLVDIGSSRFIPVFENFGDQILHKKQKITLENLIRNIDALFLNFFN